MTTSDEPGGGDLYQLPEGLPAPEDDGAADHLPQMSLPNLPLHSTSGGQVDLAEVSERGRTVVYCYPLTGTPGRDLPEGWDLIPGARGCTPEACTFRDHHEQLRNLGAVAVFGLSTQTTAYQQDLVERLHLPFEILSDSGLELTKGLDLPSFEVPTVGTLIPEAGTTTLLKRLTLVLSRGVVEKVFYPVFPPNTHAQEVGQWLADNSASGS